MLIRIIFCFFSISLLHADHAIHTNDREVIELVADPQLLLVPGFLQTNEAEQLINIAKPLLQRSKVGVAQGQIAEHRTSYSASLPKEHPVVKKIILRAAVMLGVPPCYIEPPQVVHYQKGQEFKYHHDAFPAETIKNLREQRYVTFFVYLNDLNEDQGGKTDFPKLSISVKPKKDMAVVWWDCDCYGHLDERTLHAGLPVEYGEKWGLNIWVHFGAVWRP